MVVALFSSMRKKLQLNRWGAIALLTAVCTGACAGLAAPKLSTDEPKVAMESLWREPQDLATRNFFEGVGGQALAPAESARYELVAVDSKGYSGGYDVRDAQGVTWSVKIGKEAQPEVAVSRILWGLGFHQPPVYLVHDWQLTGASVAQDTLRMARFRRDGEDAQVVGDWSWYENQFVGSDPFQGLLVVNLMLNNWDWKTSNNKIYDRANAPDGPTRVYLVRDLGASLGKTTFPSLLKWTPMRGMGQGSRNDVNGFVEQGFIKEVDGQRVKFHYNGIHRKLVDTIAVKDVVWASRLMSRVTDEQWRDAFRAGGFAPGEQQRYVEKLKSKIRDGLALAGPA
jgi:hypothetical protein